MTNHVHLIVSAHEGFKIAFIVRDLKKHTANTLLKAIIKNDRESKREWMLWMFERTGKKNASNEKYQFWQNGYHPVELNNIALIDQRLDYIHNNPPGASLSAAGTGVHHSAVSDCIYYTSLRLENKRHKSPLRSD